MPRYYFHIRHVVTDARIEDSFGVELPDLEAAQREAFESAKDLLIDAIRMDRCVDQRFEVTDDSGKIVLDLPFHRAIKLLWSLKKVRRRIQP